MMKRGISSLILQKAGEVSTVSKRNKLYLIVVFLFIIAISIVHYITSPTLWPLHDICIDLYYVPVLIGSLAFGLRGAALTYASVLILYFPYIFIVWHVKTLFLAEDLVHTLFLGLFAFVAGFLSTREARYRKQSARDQYLTALGRAAAAVAHDLRNPLTAVTAFAKRIHDGKEDSKAAAEFIMNAAQTMHKVVDGTLDFAKPLQLKLAREDINAIVERASAACEIKAEHHSVNISVTLWPAPLMMAVDASLLERALVNLIENSVDASEVRQEVTVSVISGKERAVITVTDHGSGVDKEALEHIFVPFYTTKADGTGIGMAMAKKIIDQHKGSIRISSTPNQGTRITVEVPRQGNEDALGVPF